MTLEQRIFSVKRRWVRRNFRNSPKSSSSLKGDNRLVLNGLKRADLRSKGKHLKKEGDNYTDLQTRLVRAISLEGFQRVLSKKLTRL